MLDSIRFRKLENGYTVKYHIVIDKGARTEHGYVKEVYTRELDSLKNVVLDLLDEHLT